MKNNGCKDARGFSVLQLLITIAIISVVTSLAFMGIVSARASLRLTNSARTFAAHVERARGDAVKRHATTSIQQVDGTTYSITMDFDGSGTITTRNFSTESGVVINMPRTVVFDWRGRTPIETSVGFTNSSGSSNVDITGSGDITIDAQIFHDGSIPPTTLNGPGGSVVPDATPLPGSSPTPTPDPSSPTPTPTPNPETSPTPNPDPTPNSTPDPNATPTPVPDPTPAVTPSPTPYPPPCSMTTNPLELTIGQNGSASVSVNLNDYSGSTTITATSSNSGQIQVSPGSVNVTGSGVANFTITVKKVNGSVTFASSCGSQNVPITVN
jgi:Tfp pilus assembly protein FimT